MVLLIEKVVDHVLIDNRLNIQGIEKKLFNAKVFWSWFFYGTYVWIILFFFFFCFLILSDNSVNDQGLTFNFWETSTSLYCLIVIACNVL